MFSVPPLRDIFADVFGVEFPVILIRFWSKWTFWKQLFLLADPWIAGAVGVAVGAAGVAGAVGVAGVSDGGRGCLALQAREVLPDGRNGHPVLL